VLYNTGDEVTFTFSAKDDDADDAMSSADDNSLLLRVELKPTLSWEYGVEQYDAPQFFNFHNPNDVDYRRNDPTNPNAADTRNGWHQLVFTGDTGEAGFKFAEDIAEAPTTAEHMIMCDDADFTVGANASCYEITSSDTDIVEIGSLEYADPMHSINFKILKPGNVTVTVTYKAWDNATPPELTERSKDLSVRVNVVDEP
jgi:hypothetical protein